MVDTAIFSIFHRAPPLPAPPPEPVAPVVTAPSAPEPDTSAPVADVPQAVAPPAFVEPPHAQGPDHPAPAEPEESTPHHAREPVAEAEAPHLVAATPEPEPIAPHDDHREEPVSAAEAPVEEPHDPSALHFVESTSWEAEGPPPTEAEPVPAHEPPPEAEAVESAHAEHEHPPAPIEHAHPAIEPEPTYPRDAELSPEPNAEIEPVPEQPPAPHPDDIHPVHLIEAEPEIEAWAEETWDVEVHGAEPSGVEAWDEPPPQLVAQEAGPSAWHGPVDLSGVALEADQLGLANPVIITLLARLRDSPAIELDASQTGIYRPSGIRAASWSGFAHDQAEDSRTGVVAGTRILTSRGEVEVETLIPGDTVMTLRAPALVPIVWIGKTSTTGAPILIEAGALGHDMPRRALYLAPDQPVYLDPVPVSAGHLVNGTTIRPADIDEVDLFHIDVGKSEILFAEGLPLSSSERSRVQAA